MAISITIPRLGWNMDEGIFAGWLKRDGDAVRPGEPLFSLEGDKATQEIESLDPGVLKIPATAPGVGDRVLVGAVIGYLLQPGEGVGDESASPDPKDMVSFNVNGGDNPPPNPPPQGGRAFNEPLQRGESLDDSLPPCGGGLGWGVAPAGDIKTNPDRRPSTPLARRLAREMGVDWTKLRGSGQGGRVRKADVLEAARKAPAARRTIAARMVESHQTTAPVTLTTTVDATNLVNLRGQFKTAGRAVPSFTDFVVKLVALALREHPHLNARWAGDRIEIADEIHVGIAVDTEAGLFVPVIRDAAGLSLGRIAECSLDLVGRARENRLLPGEMRGGTFTVTNLGAFGVEAFTPIINPPECAILGLGRISRQPVMDGDRVVARERLTLSLTFDHRIVDGAPAARFLQALGRLVENPGPWLIG